MSDNVLHLSATASRDMIPAERTGEFVDCKLVLKPRMQLVTEVDWTTSANICLLIDCSGSMTGDKIEAAVYTAKMIVEMLHERHQLSLIAFETDSRIIFRNEVPSVLNKDNLRDQIDQLNGHLIGMTDMAGGIERAIECFVDSSANTNIALVISDGVPDSVTAAQERAEEASRMGVQFYAVGVGKDYNADQLLSLVFPSNGAVYADDEVDRMDEIFRGIMQRIDRIFATNVRLDIDHDERAELVGVDRVAPDTASLDLSKLEQSDDNLKLQVGNIEGDNPYEFLLSFELESFAPGTTELLTARLDYDFYNNGVKSEESQAVSLEIEFVEQEAQPADASADEPAEADAVLADESGDEEAIREGDEDPNDLWSAGGEDADIDYELDDTGMTPLDVTLRGGETPLDEELHPDEAPPEEDSEGILVEEYVLDEDSPPAASAAALPSFDLVLIDAGENPIRLMREIRDAIEIDVYVAAEIIRSTNTVVATIEGRTEAEQLQERLAAVGGRAELREAT